MPDHSLQTVPSRFYQSRKWKSFECIIYGCHYAWTFAGSLLCNEILCDKLVKSFNEFFTVPAKKANENSIVFRNEDLLLPFISYDESMWNYFEPELAKRLSDLDVDESTSARVRSALTELLPGGVCGIEDVVEKLGLSKRTLQRKLSEENTTFQQQLNSTREMLAIHYIRNTDISTNDIAFLLGYQEINSFLRAFKIWTGKSISEYKSEVAGA